VFFDAQALLTEAAGWASMERWWVKTCPWTFKCRSH